MVKLKNMICKIFDVSVSGKQTTLIISMLVGLAVSVIFSMYGFAQDCDNISNKILRLHIIANSDSKEDQELKLKVRDSILALNKDIFTDKIDLETAKTQVKKNTDKIISTAEKTIKENGYNYSVNAGLVHMYFDTRTYDDIAIPSGYYDALRITIGEGKGKNWWCVLYPSLCLGGALNSNEFADVLNEDEMDIIQNYPKYEVKFKLLELFNSLVLQ